MPLKRPFIPTIVSQHVEDAASLRAVRSVLVRAPHVELLQLGRADERLHAHLDGLAIAGDDGYRLAQTASRPRASASSSSWPSPPSSATTAHKSIACWRWWGWSRCGARPGVRLRLGVAGLAARPDRRPARFGRCHPALARHCGLCIAPRRPGWVLASAIEDTSDLLRAQALQAAGQVGRVDLLEACISRGRGRPCGPLPGRGLGIAVGGGVRAARALQAMAQEPEPSIARLCNSCCFKPTRRRPAPWCANSSRASTMRLVIQATGWAGDVQTVPWLIQQMVDPPQARVAGEAFTLLTGTDLARLDLEGPSPETVEGGPTEAADDDNVALDEDEGCPGQTWPA